MILSAVKKYIILICALFIFVKFETLAQNLNTDSLSALKHLSLEELMNINITIVSKQPQKLFEAPASVYVITGQDIKRFGAATIPEALRLAPNLNVAQVNSSQWAISARGFNNVLANKLLVMIDGRVIFTPLYAGVFWDVNNILLDDVERIEVISGPGGTLWGANAVNGVINIITKNSNDTKGLLVEGASGNELDYSAALRYGNQLNPDLSYRLYGNIFRKKSTDLTNGSDANDSWRSNQGGFRLDWNASEKSSFTLHGDYYKGKVNPDGSSPVKNEGGNIITRWSHKISENSGLQLQLFYDQTWRDFGSGFNERLTTYDFDGQHKFLLGNSNEIIWGIGFRLMNHNVNNLPLFAFMPSNKYLHLYSIFIQDEIILKKDFLNLTFGSKFEHNDYTGFEIQPSIRVTLKPKNQTLWAAVSRAVRTPSRLEREFLLSLAPGISLISGNPDFESESLIAYELGWRLHPSEIFSTSLTLFYNDYDNLRSAEPGPPPLNLPIMIDNGVEGKTYGIEMVSTCQVSTWWFLKLGYTFLKKNLSIKPDSKDLNNGTAESDDPEHQLQIQSSMDLLSNVELNANIRYVDELRNMYVPGYLEMDLKVQWKLNKYLELALVGQNLLHDNHPEFVPSSPSPRLIERSFYGKIYFTL